MNVYAELALLAATVTYIVDASGFTQSWRGMVARSLRTTEERLKPLPPFDCSTCAVWWSCLIWAIIRGLDLVSLAECAALSLMAMPFGMLLNSIRDLISTLIGRIRI